MMDNSVAYRRGDVVLLPFPFVSDPSRTKERPALVVQNDVGNRFSPNLIVAAISSRLPKRAYPTVYIIHAGTAEAENAGLAKDSVVDASVLLTVPKARVSQRLGRLSDRAMEEVNQCLRVSLAL